MSPVRDRDMLRVLVVEDDRYDAELVVDELRADGLSFESQVVDDEAAFRSALDLLQPSIVISDVSMPGFSGHRALEILREKSPITPFIFVSGTLGEEAAHRGAQARRDRLRVEGATCPPGLGRPARPARSRRIARAGSGRERARAGAAIRKPGPARGRSQP